MSVVDRLHRLTNSWGHTPMKDRVEILEKHLLALSNTVLRQRQQIANQKRQLRSLNRLYNAYLAGVKSGAKGPHFSVTRGGDDGPSVTVVLENQTPTVALAAPQEK